MSLLKEPSLYMWCLAHPSMDQPLRGQGRFGSLSNKGGNLRNPIQVKIRWRRGTSLSVLGLPGEVGAWVWLVTSFKPVVLSIIDRTRCLLQRGKPRMGCNLTNVPWGCVRDFITLKAAEVSHALLGGIRIERVDP